MDPSGKKKNKTKNQMLICNTLNLSSCLLLSLHMKIHSVFLNVLMPCHVYPDFDKYFFQKMSDFLANSHLGTLVTCWT